MSDRIKNLWIDETHRAAVYYDSDAQCPRGDWEMLTGALTVNGGRHSDIEVPPVYEHPGELSRAYDALSAENVQRWSRIFYDIELSWEPHRLTFWWVDPDHLKGWEAAGRYKGTPLYKYGADGNLLTKHELELRIIESEQQTYDAWANGEVYGVEIEQLSGFETQVGVGDDGNLVILNEAEVEERVEAAWYPGESCWGFYLDPGQDEDAQFIEFAKGLY